MTFLGMMPMSMKYNLTKFKQHALMHLREDLRVLFCGSLPTLTFPSSNHHHVDFCRTINPSNHAYILNGS